MKPAADPAFVYMLRCWDGSLYTGWTTDIERRVRAHNSGKGAKYTRSRGPVKLVYLEQLEGKSAALRREAAIKKLGVSSKMKLIQSSENLLLQQSASFYQKNADFLSGVPKPDPDE